MSLSALVQTTGQDKINGNQYCDNEHFM